jgi:hypothetical protein
MHTWKAGTNYAPGDVVLHEGKTYQKLDDGDQTRPDEVPGGWLELRTPDVQQYLTIEASLTSYEQRRDAHQAAMKVAKASALKKLEALGLTVEELQALGV